MPKPTWRKAARISAILTMAVLLVVAAAYPAAWKWRMYRAVRGEDGWERQRALWKLAAARDPGLPVALEQVIVDLASADDLIGADYAALVIQVMGEESGRPLLSRLLSSTNEVVRAVAYRTAWEITDEELHPAARQDLKSDAPLIRRRAAYWILCLCARCVDCSTPLDCASAFEVLLDLLSDEDEEVAAQAFGALGSLFREGGPMRTGPEGVREWRVWCDRIPHPRPTPIGPHPWHRTWNEWEADFKRWKW